MSNFKGKRFVLDKVQKKCNNPSKVDCLFSTQFDQVGRPVPTATDHVDPPTPTMLGHIGQTMYLT